jgi:hypothetical protein
VLQLLMCARERRPYSCLLFFLGPYRLEFVDRELSGATTNLLSALWFPALLVRCLSDLCKDAHRVFCSEGGSSDLL